MTYTTGDDLLVANMSVASAEAFCLANASCTGFSLHTSECSATTVGQIFFKSRFGATNGDTSWRTHIKEIPCSLESGLDNWRPAQGVRTGNGGRTLEVSGADRPAVAVRFAWRAFPCERLGCGVYAAGEGGIKLPPPPFYAKL